MTPEPILEGLVGSHAYGLAHEGSDRDWLGVWVAPKAKKLGVRRFDESRVEREPEDRTLHEVSKFARLAADANPTVSELLWLPEYRVQSEAGRLLVEGRRLFLSKRARHSYGGYAEQQVRKLLARGDFGSDLRHRTEKHARHCWRLIEQGFNLAARGELAVRLDGTQATLCRRAGERASAGPERYAEEARAFIAKLDVAFDASDLPDEPDWDGIDRLVAEVYERAWHGRPLPQVRYGVDRA